MAAPMNHNNEVTLAKKNLEKFKVSCGIDPEDANCPHVIRGVTETWPCISWSVSKLGELVGNKLVKFRIGPRRIRNGKVLWESLCSYEEAKLSDFEEWCSLSQGTLSQQNPLRKYDRDKFWCYADYKYMKDLFCDKQQIFEAIPWDSLGLNGYNGEQSTIWIGSSRAHTVCHQDSYGFNLVAQIQGRKKWYLFPPEQTDCLYPTRLPYEESSIFSEVNITEPDLAIHPKFQDSTPHVIVLEPGDVLYVPRHWWHYVECLDTSISVNCWVELENDHLSRLHESVTRMLVYGLLHHHPQQNDLNPDWLNPTETLTSHNTNLLYLENSLEIVKQLNGQRTAKGEASEIWDGRGTGISSKSHEPVESKQMSADSSEVHILRDGMLLDNEKRGVGQVVKSEDMAMNSSKRIGSELSCESGKRKQCAMTVSRIPPISVNEMLGCKYIENVGGASKDEDREDRGIMEVLTQCVTDPRVVAMVTDLLLEKLQNR